MENFGSSMIVNRLTAKFCFKNPLGGVQRRVYTSNAGPMPLLEILRKKYSDTSKDYVFVGSKINNSLLEKLSLQKLENC